MLVRLSIYSLSHITNFFRPVLVRIENTYIGDWRDGSVCAALIEDGTLVPGSHITCNSGSRGSNDFFWSRSPELMHTSSHTDTHVCAYLKIIEMKTCDSRLPQCNVVLYYFG